MTLTDVALTALREILEVKLGYNPACDAYRYERADRFIKQYVTPLLAEVWDEGQGVGEDDSNAPNPYR